MNVNDVILLNRYGSNIILKDSYNGREFKNPLNHTRKEVTGIYARIDTDNTRHRAQAVLVAWVAHEFKEGETS